MTPKSVTTPNEVRDNRLCTQRRSGLRIAPLLLLTLVPVGCDSLVLQRRHAYATHSWIAENTADDYVRVDVSTSFVRPAEKDAVRNPLAGVPDPVQTQLAHIAATNMEHAKNIAAMFAPTASAAPPEANMMKVVPDRIPLTLVVSVDRVWHSPGTRTKARGAEQMIFREPADRIAALEIGLTLAPDAPARFLSWDKFKTEYMTVELGKISASDSLTGKAALAARSTHDASIPIPAPAGTNQGSLKSFSEVGPSAELSFNAKQEYSHTLSNRIVKLSGVLHDKNLRIRQESAPSIDLSGNNLIEIDLDLTNCPFRSTIVHRLIRPKGTTNQVEVKEGLLVYPVVTRDITACLDYAFLYRRVVSNGEYIPESRHGVQHAYGEFRDGGSFTGSDLKDVRGFCDHLLTDKQSTSSVYGFLWRNLSANTREKVAACRYEDASIGEIADALATDLNWIAGREALYKQWWAKNAASNLPGGKILEPPKREGIVRLNRLLLHGALSDHIVKSSFTNTAYPRLLLKKEHLVPRLYGLEVLCPSCSTSTNPCCAELRWRHSGKKDAAEICPVRLGTRREAAELLALLQVDGAGTNWINAPFWSCTNHFGRKDAQFHISEVAVGAP